MHLIMLENIQIYAHPRCSKGAQAKRRGHRSADSRGMARLSTPIGASFLVFPFSAPFN